MSTAKLNVWVTRVGDPCKIDMEHQWYVHVLQCDGELLDWCGRLYTNIPTKCGHLEIEIPPGCYTVCATWSPGATGPIVPTSLGNHITHLFSVRANCGDDVCVTLFPPTLHWCGVWTLHALRENIALDRMPPEAGDAAKAAVDALGNLLNQLPQDEFTRRMMRIMENPPEATTEKRSRRTKKAK